MTDPIATATASPPSPATSEMLRRGVWIVLPTYNEAENIGPISAAILTTLPDATLLVVDD